MTDSIERLQNLVRVQRDIERGYNQAQEAADKLKALLTDINEQDIPELMRELEISKLTLNDGSSLSFKDDFRASVRSSREEDAVVWLEKENADGIVKTVIKISYSKGERALAEKHAERIRKIVSTTKLPRAVSVDYDIHAQTLAAFVRERAEHGEELPEECFNVMPFSKAKITAPKAAPARAMAKRQKNGAA